MSKEQKIKILLRLQALVLGLTAVLWFTVDFDRASFLTLSCATLGHTGVFFLKRRSIRKPETYRNNFTAILSFYTINTLLYLCFEAELISWLVQFSFAIFIFEVVIYSYKQAPTNLQIGLLMVNFGILATCSVFPSLAFGWVVLNDTVILIIKVQIITVWTIGMGVLFTQLRKTSILLEEKTKAEANTQWYSDLFSILSHNIRTPLTTIYNISQILALKKTKTEPMIISEELYISLSESSNLSLKVVDEILKRDSVLKIQGGNLSLSEFILGYENDHPQVRLTTSPWIKTTLLENKEQLAMGLSLDVFIDNAKRFGATDIHLYSPKKGILHIQDNGPGMSEEVLNYYGKPFNPYKSKDSSGLGTYFASELLTRSGWEMQALPSEQGALIQLSKRVI